MPAQVSLPWKIAFLAILTLVMLTGVLLVFAGVQFRISPENFIVGPALNRILSVSGEKSHCPPCTGHGSAPRDIPHHHQQTKAVLG